MRLFRKKADLRLSLIPNVGENMKCIYCNLVNAWYYSTPLTYT
jgi:hypothetical protein